MTTLEDFFFFYHAVTLNDRCVMKRVKSIDGAEMLFSCDALSEQSFFCVLVCYQ